MSNSLAIAAVTATLRSLLEQGINTDPGLNFTPVTTQPPDKARGNGDGGNQLNLFLYQTVPSSAWRNTDLHQQVKPGEIGVPPLALDLYYLITAYGRNNDDVLSHRVLGRAMSVLHDHPLLGAAEIKAATQTDLADSDLHEQVERVRITWKPIELEEQSRLWATFQTQYRISAAYQAAVVLIESTRPIRAGLPVLMRGRDDRGVRSQPDLTPPFPTLTEALPPNGQPAVRLDETLTIKGFNLDGTNRRLRFMHPRLIDPIERAPTTADSSEWGFALPNEPANWPAGIYTVSATMDVPGDQPRTTNELAFALAPTITIAPTNAAPGDVALTLTVAPELRPGQRIALLFGSREVRVAPLATPTDTLNLTVPDVTAGDYFVRLRVDGVDSLLVNHATTPPTFFDDQKVTIA